MQWWENSLAQLGAIGLLLGFCLLVISVLWKAFSAALDRERAIMKEVFQKQEAWTEALGAVEDQLEKVVSALNTFTEIMKARQ